MIATLARRHLRLFFRDRMAVFFSLLSAIILFGLYKLFLGNLQTTGLAQQFPRVATGDISAFVDSWMFAGIITVTTVTTGLSALEVFVNDRASGRFKDFVVSPLSRAQLIGGYMLSSFAISTIMSLLVVAFSLTLLGLSGAPLPPGAAAQVAGYTVLLCLTFSAISAFTATFVRTTGAFSSLAALVSTFAGFVAGAYLPMGIMPTGVQHVLAVLPFAPAGMLLRSPMTAHALDGLAGGRPATAQALKDTYGMALESGSFQVTTAITIVTLSALAVIFALLGAWRLGKKIG